MSQAVSNLLELLHRFWQSVGWREATLVFLVLGVVLRALAYLNGGALYLDEAMTALNLSNRSFAELLEPLDYNQIAPVGWLILHKAILGISIYIDYTLPLPTFLAGIATVFIAYRISRRHLEWPGTFLIVALIAVIPIVLIYSVAVRAYGIDIFLSILIILLSLNVLREPKPTLGQLAPLLTVGSVSLFFSFPVVLMLGSAGISLLSKAYFENQKKLFFQLVFIGSVWLSLFAFVYLTFHSQPSEVVSFMEGSWSSGFAPIPFTSFTSLYWYPSTLQNVWGFQFTDEASFMVGALYFLGLFALYRSDRPHVAILMIMPLGLSLIASMLNLYPFEGRVTLFLIPTFVCGAGFGLDFLVRKAKNGLFAASFFAGILVLSVTWKTFALFASPVGTLIKDNVHPAMSVLSQDAEVNDTIYLYYGSLPSFWLYRDRYEGIREFDVIYGRSLRRDSNCLLMDLTELQNRGRVWVLFAAHLWGRNVVKEDEVFLKNARKMADVVVDRKFGDVRLVLLDFNHMEDEMGKLLQAFKAPDEDICLHYWASPIPD